MHPPLHARPATGSCHADNQGPRRPFSPSGSSMGAAPGRMSAIAVARPSERRGKEEHILLCVLMRILSVCITGRNPTSHIELFIVGKEQAQYARKNRQEQERGQFVYQLLFIERMSTWCSLDRLLCSLFGGIHLAGTRTVFLVRSVVCRATCR